MANSKTSQNKKRLNPILLSKDDAILMFLWRHRIATFLALKTIFYPDVSNQQAYFNLRRLRRGQYLRVDRLDGTKNITWRLDLRGFQYLAANHLPELRTKGFRPQSPYHDLFVAGVLLGRWAVHRPKCVKIITEQELNSLELSFLPQELRKERERQPDGLWIFQTGKVQMAVALEVELSGKSDARYDQICSFYASQTFFEHVLWIVKDKSLAQRILDASRRHGIPREGVHLFILLGDFEKLGWDSKFQNKSLENVTLDAFLNHKAGSILPVGGHPRLTSESPLNHPEITNGEASPFLDFRVSLENLGALRATQERNFS